MRGRVARIRRRPGAAIAALVLVGAVFAGCAGIPTGGRVTTTTIDTGVVEDDLGTLATGPAADATPDEIIEGFIRAGRDPQNQYAVAREYLTDELATQWLPTERVLVSASTIVPQAVTGSTYSVAVAVSASVDADGRYSTVLPVSSEQWSVALVQNDKGQWRISSVPNGTVLPPSRFRSIFDAYELYFFDPSFHFLVPELRWFVSRNVASRIVSELLNGPSAPYAGALLSAFPAGTKLTRGGVTISSGRATVPLSSEVQGESALSAARMQSQLSASLSSLSNVVSVVVSVGGFVLDTAEAGSPPDQNPQVGADPVGAQGGAFGLLTTDGVSRLAAIGASADALAPDAASLASDRQAAAVRATRGAAGVFLVRGGADPVLLDSRPGLVAPSLDSDGFTWSVPAGHPDALLAISPTGTALPIAGLPSGAQLVSLDVSRDGARLLVALQTPAGPELRVAGIVRASNGTPSALVAPAISLAVGASPLIDATWVDGAQVATLSGAGADTEVDLYEIGGEHLSLGSVDSGVQLVGGNTAQGLRVRDAEGRVRRPSGGSTWQDTGIVASFLATQQ
ncbi:MAG TPA: LpqB family beta-propeller domain-containing protein [Pseudolysinimonas sp.]|nr:LpqB family beta-propeller domain-containing protein [Pseudolysinimonas sp.]